MTNKDYLSQLKVLYVEDDQNTREDLKGYLNKKVGKVITAIDGQDGLKKYEETQPDMVIADILMPKINGIEMLRRIRQRGGKCPFIITSTVDETNTIIEAVDIGIVKYVVKPIILEDLLSALHKVAAELNKDSSGARFKDLDEKRAIESEIKKYITAYLKKSIGKGPRDLSVFISNEELEISAFDTMTPLEKKLMEDRRNISIIEQIHRSYYHIVKEELEQELQHIMNVQVTLKHTEFLAARGADKLIFKIVSQGGERHI